LITKGECCLALFSVNIAYTFIMHARSSWPVLFLFAMLSPAGCGTQNQGESVTNNESITPPVDNTNSSSKNALSHESATVPEAQTQSLPAFQTTTTFTPITSAAGIHFRHNNGATGLRLMPESMGSGAVFIDYDSDGWQDIFFVNGRDWMPNEVRSYKTGRWSQAEIEAFTKRYPNRPYRPGMERVITPQPARQRTTGALYRNNKNGTFSDVTRGSGLDVEMLGMGAAVGDYDNDSKPDLYVTALGHNYLFKNQSDKGQARFNDVTQSTNAQDKGWSTGAMWVDYDRDGWLDLFVCHYVEWRPGIEAFETINGIDKTYTGPNNYQGTTSRLFRNKGNGRFEDVSVKAGIRPLNLAHATATKTQHLLDGKALGVALCDVNKDGWPDLAVANDAKGNFLFVNNKNGTFREVGTAAGVAYSPAARARAGMGIAVADIDHSDRESIAIGNFPSSE
jgi:hypothetical protein